MAAKAKPTKSDTTAKDVAPTDVEAGDTPDPAPTLLRSVGSTPLDEVPDNTPTPRNQPEGGDTDRQDEAAPAGYTYVVHPKNGVRCLVDAKSVPELEVDGYERA